MRFDDDFFSGDARRCPRHPHVKTSSDDGMFDGVCGECEMAMEDLSEDYPGQYISAPGDSPVPEDYAPVDSLPAEVYHHRVDAANATWDEDDIPF